MGRWWLIPVSEENWYKIKTLSLYGAPSLSPRQPWKKIKKKDFMIFYIKKRDSKDLGGMLTGLYKVISEWFLGTEPIWPDEVRASKIIYMWRVKINKVMLSKVFLNDILHSLSFIKDKTNYSFYLMGTPANLGRPLPQHDVKVILKAFKSYSDEQRISV